jgi:N utilization substance protein A
MISKEFFENVELMANERGITVEQALDAVKEGLIKAYRKANGNASARVEFKPDKNEILMYSQRLVVEEIDPTLEIGQITLADAKAISNRYKLGDTVEQKIDPKKEFGRMAVSTGKQTFNQSIRNAEKGNIAEYFKKCEGEMIDATVLRVDEKGATLSLANNYTTFLPRREILANDNLIVGTKIKVYLVSVEDAPKGPRITVSRSDKNLVIRLMEQSIPEIQDGTIEIMGIARDAGDRSKVAICSVDPNVDAIGSCVGEKGARINSIVSALNGEKIDLYKYSSVPEELIANSLQPATVLAVIDVDPKAKTSLAIVPDDQLSLAIGKSGQNVRLAVQSCGWKIDIKSESEAKAEGRSF